MNLSNFILNKGSQKLRFFDNPIEILLINNRILFYHLAHTLSASMSQLRLYSILSCHRYRQEQVRVVRFAECNS